jgi:hypothetical protein
MQQANQFVHVVWVNHFTGSFFGGQGEIKVLNR